MKHKPPKCSRDWKNRQETSKVRALMNLDVCFALREYLFLKTTPKLRKKIMKANKN